MLNRFKICPNGVVSKKDIGACKICNNTGECNLCEARIPPSINAKEPKQKNATKIYLNKNYKSKKK